MRGLLRHFTLALLGLVFLAPAVMAAPHFPVLIGRVVDNAHILSASDAGALEGELAHFEQESGTQLVIVTLASLEGMPIEEYGYLLGRYWGIGQKGKNNGVLFLIAPSERKLRIDVGYGLEGTLTDALASSIIHQVVLPDFKAGQMARGIRDGTDAIIATLGGHAVGIAPVQARGAVQEQPHGIGLWGVLLFVLFVFFAIRHPFLAMLLFANSGFRVGGSGGRDDNFSGGGGSFGGGGAGGSW